MEHVTFDDIPYHTIVECIAIHLGMKEFGAMSMMSVYLRDTFMSNDVWKRLYVHTLRDKFKITDKSIHVGPRLSDHKDRTPSEELPWSHRYRAYWNVGNAPWYSFTGPYQHTMYRCMCVPSSSIIHGIAHETCQRVRVDPVTDLQHDTESINKYVGQKLKEVVLERNKSMGHNHSHICTNIDHYLFDTLDAPKSVRNYKDFRKQVLSKHLTQVKKNSDMKKATVRINRKEEKIRQYKSYLRQLMMDIESDKAVVDKNESLCNSLSMALKK
jgi:hypothetical protein